MAELQLPEWTWPALLGGGAVLLSCQLCAIGYIFCSHRGRYEGRTFWYRGKVGYAVDVVGCCSFEAPSLAPIRVGELQHDLRNGRAYWSGQWGRDYRFHVANFHPLLSIFFSHPLHPFGKVARALVLAITVAFMVGWRRVVQERVQHLPGNWDEEIVGKVHGLTEIFHLHIRGQLVLFCYVSLPSMAAEQFFTKLATLHDNISDFHREYGAKSWCTKMVSWFISLMGWVASLLFYALVCTSLGYLVYTVYALRHMLNLGQGSEECFYFTVLMPVCLAQIWFVWWFVFDLLSPAVGFGLCRFFRGLLPCLRLCFWQWWAEEEGVLREPTWRVADTAHASFGAEVDSEAFTEETTSILREGTGLVHDSTRDQWVCIERVAEADLEKWLASKISGAERGHELLTQMEQQRAHSQKLKENECTGILPHCCSPKCARVGYRDLAVSQRY